MTVELAYVYELPKEDRKKYVAIFSVDGEPKKVKFGASGYEDYTTHHDKTRRDSYRNRHRHDNLDNPLSPGALSYYILWGDSTSITANINHFVKLFDLWSRLPILSQSSSNFRFLSSSITTIGSWTGWRFSMISVTIILEIAALIYPNIFFI